MGIARCNQFCRLAGLAILLSTTAFFELRSPIFGDFVQFYMTGLVDRAGAWDALYPVPIPGSIHNAGDCHDSTAKPSAEHIAAAHGVDLLPYHFILPPPAAILSWPLGYFNGHTAHRLWLLLSVLAGWATAIQAGMILQRCAGRPTRWVGLITLMIAAMPAMRRAVLVANLTPMMSATIAWGVLSLMDEGQPLSAASAIVLGTLSKYAAAMLVPIAVVQRRWRTIGWGVVFTTSWCFITFCIMGRLPFIEYMTAIAPTLSRSHEMADNISLAGVLIHALHRMPPLPDGIMGAISLLRLPVLAAIVLPMTRLGKDRMREPAAVCSASLALLAWLLVFSPVAWSHYLIYLCPLWGWLACPIDQPPVRRAAGWIAIALIVFSPDQMPAPEIDPWGVHLLMSLGLMLGLGISELYTMERQPKATHRVLTDTSVSGGAQHRVTPRRLGASAVLRTAAD